MKILIVAATKNEVLPIINHYKALAKRDNLFTFELENIETEILITGIGSVQTTYEMMKHISLNKPDLAINMGICGSFVMRLAIGQIVWVCDDIFGDLGMETANGIDSIFDRKFADSNSFPFQNGVLKSNTANKLQIENVTGLTVNTSHCEPKNIEIFTSKYKPDIETMEGAAFFYTCLRESVKCLQVRAVSNYVLPRHDAQWDIKLAIDKLAQFFISRFETITKMKE